MASKLIAAAFVAAQRKFGPLLRDRTNPHFKSRYADLATCLDVVTGPLNECGIGVCQLQHPCDDGVIVETLLIHESGEEMSFGKLHVPASKQDAQGYGSCLTYARRYSLMAALGIAPEDDDGNAASQSPRQPAQQQQRPAPKPEPTGTRPALHDSLRTILGEFGWPNEKKREYSEKLLESFGSSLGECMDNPACAVKVAEDIEAELITMSGMSRPEALQTLFADIMETPKNG
jgi:hypothetical protein